MAKAPVTTPAQQAEARRVAELTGRKYKTILRGLQRASEKGKADKQVRSGTKLKQELKPYSQLLSAAVERRPEYRQQTFKTRYGPVKTRKSGNVDFYRNVDEPVTGTRRYDLFSASTRAEAMQVAAQYHLGQGDQLWANIRATRFHVEFVAAGTRIRVPRRSKRRGKRSYSTDVVTDAGQGGQWIVFACDLVASSENYAELIDTSEDDPRDVYPPELLSQMDL